MDGDESRQSIHEIGLARQVMLVSGKAELVTVSTPTPREGNRSGPKSIPGKGGHDFGPSQRHYDEVEGESIAVLCATRNLRLTVGFQDIYDRWAPGARQKLHRGD